MFFISSQTTIILLICLFFSISSHSQNNTSANASKEVTAVQAQLSEKIEGRERVVFGIADTNFLVIVKEGKKYVEYYLVRKYNDSIPKLIKTKKKKENDLYIKMFDKTLYQDEFISFDSGFYQPNGYEVASGNLTYFSFQDENGKNYGEAKLSVFIKPNPIDTTVYYYLVQQVLKHLN
jgi:hypothetical protein